ncbi:CbtB-domain containing protein [Acidovorax sp. LjRoot66]|uniref:CbtB domain-containing protein n=1 Tax=Acidovorax sp. LjRoot66 TaxID=3342334 RepID=UPI003ECDCD12
MHSSPIAQDSTAGLAGGARSLLLQLSAGAVLGLVVMYGVTFSTSPIVHNAAHDVRHVTVKPCH